MSSQNQERLLPLRWRTILKPRKGVCPPALPRTFRHSAGSSNDTGASNWFYTMPFADQDCAVRSKAAKPLSAIRPPSARAWRKNILSFMPKRDTTPPSRLCSPQHSCQTSLQKFSSQRSCLDRHFVLCPKQGHDAPFKIVQSAAQLPGLSPAIFRATLLPGQGALRPMPEARARRALEGQRPVQEGQRPVQEVPARGGDGSPPGGGSGGGREARGGGERAQGEGGTEPSRRCR